MLAAQLPLVEIQTDADWARIVGENTVHDMMFGKRFASATSARMPLFPWHPHAHWAVRKYKPCLWAPYAGNGMDSNAESARAILS